MSVAPHRSRTLSAGQARWQPLEIVFWLATLLPFVLVPDYLSLASQIAITALFALSLDLILGYAGIVSLGHAAFFGARRLHGRTHRQAWLGRAAVRPADRERRLPGLVGYAPSFIVARFRHLALIMITLGLGLLLHEAANSASWLTGGADGLQGVSDAGRCFGLPASISTATTAYAYSLVVLFVCFLVARRHHPFAVRPRAARHPRERHPHAGDRRAERGRICARSTPSPR